MSRIIKATYVRLDTEPVTLQHSEAVRVENAGEDTEISILQQQERLQQRELEFEEQIRKRESELEERFALERAEIAETRSQAQRELASEREQTLANARESGHREGYEQGRREGYEEAAKTREQAVDMLHDAAEEAQRRLFEGERDILDLVFAVAAKILETELIEREELILQQIRQALRQFKQAPQVIIKVPKERYALVQSNISRLKEEFRQVLALDCLADPTLPLTDVVIDSPFGMVDVRFDAQLEILHQALSELLKEQIP